MREEMNLRVAESLRTVFSFVILAVIINCVAQKKWRNAVVSSRLPRLAVIINCIAQKKWRNAAVSSRLPWLAVIIKYIRKKEQK